MGSADRRRPGAQITRLEAIAKGTAVGWNRDDRLVRLGAALERDAQVELTPSRRLEDLCGAGSRNAQHAGVVDAVAPRTSPTPGQGTAVVADQAAVPRSSKPSPKTGAT